MDYDPKGYKNGRPGRGPKPKLDEMIGDAWGKTPEEWDYEMAARGLGLEADQIPVFETVAELQVWVFRMHALRGSKEHFQELGDRAAPKPSRMQRPEEAKNTRGATSKAPQSEADRWFAAIHGEDDDGLEDLL